MVWAPGLQGTCCQVYLVSELQGPAVYKAFANSDWPGQDSNSLSFLLTQVCLEVGRATY